MKNLLLILLCFPFLVFSQNQKRLALVIGNANYDQGKLKNPVNDALLMDSTLRILGFDVMLSTDIENKADFGNVVARLILPRLFLVFWCLEFDIAGTWRKPLSVKRCINPKCEDIYFKYYRKNDHSLWCSPRCGSALRMQKYRQKKQEQMLATG